MVNTVNDMEEQEWRQLGIEVGRIFTPSAPISVQDLFAGRKEQLRQVFDSIHQIGQHAIIYGERGVGKTSLANIIIKIGMSEESPLVAIRINADGADDYNKLWHKVFDELEIISRSTTMGFLQSEEFRKVSFANEYIDANMEISPDKVRQVLALIATKCQFLIVVDEFDRIKDTVVKTAIADTIKTLSDHSISTTIILVGVADSVTELIEGHQSVERALKQIQMPRMSENERNEIIEKGLRKLGMSIKDEAKEYITKISQGLPHYIHSIILNAAREAIDRKTKKIDLVHVDYAIEKNVEGAEQSIKTLYHHAVSSSKKNNIFKEVLLACALANTDSLGYFAAVDVRKPLSQIMKASYEIPSFARHLMLFSEESRGAILHKFGLKHRRRYRFSNPLMQPYIVMKGLKDELIKKKKNKKSGANT